MQRADRHGLDYRLDRRRSIYTGRRASSAVARRAVVINSIVVAVGRGFSAARRPVFSRIRVASGELTHSPTARTRTSELSFAAVVERRRLDPPLQHSTPRARGAGTTALRRLRQATDAAPTATAAPPPPAAGRVGQAIHPTA